MKNFIFFFSFIFISCYTFSQNFTKIITGPIVNTPGDSRSVNWIDVNNDNYLDCMITNGPSGGQNNRLYLNDGLGNFTAFSGDSLVMDHKPSDGATWADTDNDGDIDCFIVNWYNVNNLFYANNGNTSFTKINSTNLVGDGGYSETASWADFDNDGLVDLYVTNSSGTKKNFLYKNSGANTFSKIIVGDPVIDAFESRCVNWTDIDMDGDLDLFVSNESNQNENIYRNEGGGVFTKLIAGPLLNNAGSTMSGSWGDYDNDGDLDVFLANDQSNNALFRNDGNFNFVKVITDTVSKTPGRSYSSSWSDVDNDGDLDLFVTNSFKPSSKLLNYFYLNNGDASFTRINNVLTADSSWSYGCAFGDYDNDGFEDLAVATCRFNGSDANNLLYHNDGNTNNWITIKLVGTISNKAAIGAKVRVKAIIGGQAVWQMREVSAQSAYCSQNDLRVHFGLGNATIVDSIKIEWPSGILQYSINVNPNQFITSVEQVTTVELTWTSYESQTLQVYPNPSVGLLVIEGSIAFPIGTKIIITDDSGHEAVNLTIQKSTKKYMLNLKDHSVYRGTYVVTIIESTQKWSQKLILEN